MANNTKRENPPPPAAPDVSEVIAEAGKQYEQYVELTRVAGIAALVGDDHRSQNRTWKHPLGLVMNARVE